LHDAVWISLNSLGKWDYKYSPKLFAVRETA